MVPAEDADLEAPSAFAADVGVAVVVVAVVVVVFFVSVSVEDVFDVADDVVDDVVDVAVAVADVMVRVVLVVGAAHWDAHAEQLEQPHPSPAVKVWSPRK